MQVPHSKTFYKGKCPYCRQIIEFHTIHFPLDNDYGEIVAICNCCDNKFKIETKNPAESYIKYGADKKDSIDYEIRPSSVELNSIEDVIQYNGNLNENNTSFDASTKPLYICASCGCSLEQAAFLKLDASFDKICTSYNNYTVYDIKGYGFSPVKAIYILGIECKCSNSYKAVFYKKYDHSGFEITDFNLGNIINSTPLDVIIDGVMSKDDCMEILKKILIRWELFFEKILIITPFVGHQYLSDEKLIETWFSILSQITTDKAKLITRTASLNTIKKAISNKICDYKVLEEYELSVKHIDEAINLQPSHAKIYCALTEECCEIMHGSANIVYGPSKEQVTFKRYPSFKILYDNFIRPLDIKNINENECHNKFFDSSNVIFDEAKGFHPEEIKNRELIKTLS